MLDLAPVNDRGGSARLDHLAAGWRPWLLLMLLALALYLPGIATVPPIDRDEARYVQASRQMLESGDFLRIRFQDEARNKKPAGIYWLQAASVATFSDAASTAIWPYRLVSCAGATLAVLLTFGLGQHLFDRRTALVGAALLAVTVDLGVEAHLATTDAALLAAAVAAQGLLALAYLGARRGEALTGRAAFGFWLAQAAAILIKGPVVPALSLATGCMLWATDRRGRFLAALRWRQGLVLVALIVLPWLGAVEWATSGAFLTDSVGHDFAGKLGQVQEAHGAPPGSYLLLLPISFWPASLFLPALAIWAWRTRKLSATRVLTAWVVPFWILLELIPTKLPHYVLPLYPALALAAARALIAIEEEGQAAPGPRVQRIWFGVWTAVGLALAGLAVLTPLWLGGTAWPIVELAGLAIMVVVALQASRPGLGRAVVAVVAGLAVIVPIFADLLPTAPSLFVSRDAARLVEDQREPGERVVSVGYAEPSLVFLLGTDTRLLAPDAAADALAEGSVALALVSLADQPAFEAALRTHDKTAVPLGAVSGLDYSNGKRLTLVLYRSAR